MDTYDSVLDAIGSTPLIRLTRIAPPGGAPVYAKAEFFNPGGSVKDRAALSMVRAARDAGTLVPGGRIVEGTSGNTGIGLAVVAAQLGHPLTVVVPDKTSGEKIAALKAYGADVLVTAGGVPSDHPEHVRQLARRIADETGGWLADQYDNPANPAAHREYTGPELWAQTGGRLTHFVAGVGTGGTISGTGGYLKQVSDGRVRVIGADPEYSVYGGGDGSPYFVEAIGHYVHPETREDQWPLSYHREVVDEFERIGDRESILAARRLAREEGLLAGGSAGTALAAALRVAARLGPDDLVVVLLPDTGRGYLSKYFDDDWLRRNGFLEEPEGATVGAAIGRAAPPLPALPATATVAQARALVSDAPLPVFLPRPKPAGPPAAAEVLGTLRVEPTWDPADPVSSHLLAPLPTVGIGEDAGEALARVGSGEWAWVLLDGRITAAVHRDQLKA
ncbi:pyridoxal-phosphate dependent enzyme [Amycolatopsis acidiphila]|uniref:Pyridoxal-phosphate dependent enzyme n=1 Tax=Amycolatopsis acidiphila TaxID=715473 RepID=A0A558A5H2_9PSEU|nr:pyridoxal-phosphate dependent enzyme [Amycolatopsis acidiphila]TVT19514.1 pyridoxal-phosphate dependent enzyme [Amycolatopsis acidiphila]UIJ56895.1 pyridoxal-phosphate dependent enzyme [Amycolatopsis acidiphila]GHG54491.1 cystathionine beta-synthase [Amycolatopsis acidiphila]